MKHTFYLFILFFIAFFMGACSSAEKYIKRAEAALAIGEYAEAAGNYRKAYTKTPAKEREQRGKLAYAMGDCYRKYGNVARALANYRTAERYKYTDTLTQFYIGEMGRVMGDYKGAKKAYEAYLESHPESEEAKRGIASCDMAPELKKKGSLYTVKLENFFNGNRSDYCPMYLDEECSQLYFTTTRSAVTGDDLSGITAVKNGDIYFSKKDEKGKWQRPVPAEGSLNSNLDEACGSFLAGKTMYLTVCPVDPQYPRMAEVWKADRQEAMWGAPSKVALTKDTLSSCAHPAVSPDGRWIYFTSDMPGGMGGLDIWRAEFDSHGLGAVENLGAQVNTSGDEAFPAFRPSGELYFSSTGHVGMGGYDLYRATEDTITHQWNVVHLPSPMNSQGDDFGITFEGLRNRGFFSSSRSTGGRGWDKIYSFSYPEVLQTVKGWVYEQDGYELPEALVYMIGNDGTNKKITPKSDGSFEEPVAPGVKYLFLATCKNYLNVRGALNVDSLEQEKQHVLQFPLPSINIPVLVRNVFYEFDSANITEESKAPLDRLAKMLTENPNITIELAAHCDYRGRDEYNLRLSQRRAESVVRYLTDSCGIDTARLTAVGYGETVPKVVNKKLLEQHPFLHESDTLTEAYILALPDEAQREACNALNRRTEFRVLRTTYGLFDEEGNLKPDALKEEEENDK